MASAVLKYLCCCLPQPRHPQDDPERAPLLDPDILPQAPPRPQGRSTDEQRIERETLQRILDHATNRLLNIESLAAFLPSAAPAATRPSSARSRSRSSSRPASPSSSPPPTTTTTSKRRSRRPRTPSSTATTTTTTSEAWRAPLASEDADAPLAPVRVVHLGHNWEELPALRGSPAASKGGGGAERGKRPPSAHSMKTLPRRSRAPAALAGPGAEGAGAGGGAGPSPLSREAGEDDGEENGEHEDDEGEEDDSRFGTYASYRTAKSGGAGGTLKGGVRGLWGSEEDAKDGDDEGISEELSHAIARLEASIDDWSLPGRLGPFVAELGGGDAATAGGGGEKNGAVEGRRE
ncbi:uncharacterized protein JCM10292_004739 [Rhodotorula paludigena]|uniref:uncharacterized protein n=1 Tax=Rhodotorula paludigena TaxID=86838 RepID=UPI00317B8183